MIITSFDITKKRLFDICMDIRTQVFMEEQHVPANLELDGYDDEALHFLFFSEQKPVATARLRTTDKGLKLERLATLAQYRNKGYGKELMKFILEHIGNTNSINNLYLHSQDYAVEFYRKLGFETFGETFTEAGIEHFTMKHCKHG